MKLSKVESKKREDYLRKLFYLLRLRPNIYDKINQTQQKELPMPFTIEKESDPLYKEGIEKGVKKGIEKGIEKGKKKATKETKIAIAKAMIEQKMSINLIVELTGLSKEEIEKIVNLAI